MTTKRSTSCILLALLLGAASAVFLLARVYAGFLLRWNTNVLVATIIALGIPVLFSKSSQNRGSFLDHIRDQSFRSGA